MTFDYFCEVFERFINFNSDKVKKLTHSIYDFDNDGYVCELDLYTFIKVFEEDNSEFFMNVYMDDIIKIIAAIQ